MDLLDCWVADVDDGDDDVSDRKHSQSHGTEAVTVCPIFEVRSFTHSWDNRGYFKNLGSPWIRPRSLFSQIFKGLLFAWTLWIYLLSLKFIVLPIPQIIGGTQKIGAVPRYTHAPFSPKFLIGFCSHGPSEHICEIWRSVASTWLQRWGTKRRRALGHVPRSTSNCLIFKVTRAAQTLQSTWFSVQ